MPWKCIVSQSDGYRLIEQLGSGLSGAVFLAESPTGKVAIRLFQTQEEPLSPGWLLHREYFLQGAHQMATLVHLRIVSVIEVIDEETDAYVAMEYVPSETLASALDRDRFTTERANYLLRNIAVPLDYAHHNGVTHGDLKPSNIFLTPQGGAKIATILPFHLARGADAPETSRRNGCIHISLLRRFPHPTRQDLLPISIHLPPSHSTCIRASRRPLVSCRMAVQRAPEALCLPRPPCCRGRCHAIRSAATVPVWNSLTRLKRASLPRRRSPNLYLDFGRASVLCTSLEALGLLAVLAIAAALWPSDSQPKTVYTAPPPTAPPVAAMKSLPAQQPIAVTKPSPMPKSAPSALKQKPPAPPIDQAKFVPPGPDTTRGGGTGYAPKPVVDPYPPARDPRPPKPPSDGKLPDSVLESTAAGSSDPRGTNLQVYSRGRVIDPGISFSIKDQSLGELALGDLKVAVSVGSPPPKGQLSVEWLINGLRMDIKPVHNSSPVEYGNEPTPGTYRVVLRADKTVLKEFTFRITP